MTHKDMKENLIMVLNLYKEKGNGLFSELNFSEMLKDILEYVEKNEAIQGYAECANQATLFEEESEKHIATLFSVICNEIQNKYGYSSFVVKSHKSNFEYIPEGYFFVYIYKDFKSYGYYFKNEFWDLFQVRTMSSINFDLSKYKELTIGELPELTKELL